MEPMMLITLLAIGVSVFFAVQFVNARKLAGAEDNGAACAFLYFLLWRISMADGTLDPAEDKMMSDIALYLGVDKGLYADLKAGKRPRFDKADLRQAGVPSSLAGLAQRA